MRKLLYKYLIFIFQKTSIMVGGQAVIEGVMMRVPGYYATAIRDKDNHIHTERHVFHSIVEKYSLSNIYILRGFIHLIDSMKIGFKTLEWSSSFLEDEVKKNNKLLDMLFSLLSIIFAIGLFMGIPYYITNISLASQSYIVTNDFTFNIIAGTTRLLIFIMYLYGISFMQDIKRLFQYHGAEHKVVYNFESGSVLNIKHARKFSTQHPRCGTSFVFILMLVTIITYSLIDGSLSYAFEINFTTFSRIGVHLLCLPLVTGIGYELLKFLSKHQHNFFFSLLSKPGLWLQTITTNEPDDKQLEVSIIALKTAFGDQINEFKIGEKFQADAIA